jgi:RNA-directed DNA polymerase
VDATERANNQAILSTLRTRGDVARLLGMSTPRLKTFLYKTPRADLYREFQLKKRGAGFRTIRAPLRPLKQAQLLIARLLYAFYEPRGCVYGYVDERNIQDNAEWHVAKRWVLRVDLKDFFPSIHFGRVWGLLRAKPFSLPAEVATVFAQLCTHLNELPQGSPASPVLSNLVCRGLDYALSALARQYRCKYTRYCDDLIFSTNRRGFPAGLAEFHNSSEVTTTRVGASLLDAITKAGFEVNPAKVQLRSGSQRQMVTGLVTNAKVNVPRKFVRDLRVILFIWRVRGTDEAAEWYFANHDKKNRPKGKDNPVFEHIVRGKLQYLGSVRGWDDPLYRRLGAQLAQRDPTFRLRAATPAPRNDTLHVFVEGKTDHEHIAFAMVALKFAEQHQNIVIEFAADKDRGSAELIKLC